ncbi:hypothetical protein Cgig2_030094 [Carnegiea gigantea]|uniref:Uncharacterized protein n=1 Tax=Carnegiea gigantea TaxID=171969 RepID=A0A9Q1GQ16_9CARY|nr:hypothetical protein Cgig2_030094 [Carnegiea gigantea]
MFRSRITLEECLKSVQHEDVVGENMSLDDIDMIPDLEEEEVEHEKEHQREPGPLEWFMETHQDKEGPYHEPTTKKFVDIAVDIVKRKTGASEVVFSEAIVLIETFAYHKLMGPESSGRVRGNGSGVTSTQLNAKRNCQSRIKPSDSSIVSLLLKEVQSLHQEVTYLKSQRTDDARVLSQGDDVEENQRNNTPLVAEPIRDSLAATPTLAKNNEVYIKDASQIENTTVLRDKGGVAHTSRSPHVLNQSYDQNTSIMENMNTSGCSNQSNIARRLNFDQRE